MPDIRELQFDEINELSKLIALAFRDYPEIEAIHSDEVDRQHAEINDKGYEITLPVILVKQSKTTVESYVKELLKKLNEDKLVVKLALRPLYRRSFFEFSSERREAHEEFREYLETNFTVFEKTSILEDLVSSLGEIIDNIITTIQNLLVSSPLPAPDFSSLLPFHEKFKLVALLKGYHDLYHHIVESNQNVFFDIYNDEMTKVRSFKDTKRIFVDLRAQLKLIEEQHEGLTNNQDFQNLYQNFFLRLPMDLDYIIDLLGGLNILPDDEEKIREILSLCDQGLQETNAKMVDCQKLLGEFDFRTAFDTEKNTLLGPAIDQFSLLVKDDLIVKQLDLHSKWQGVIENLKHCLEILDGTNPDKVSMSTQELIWVKHSRFVWRNVFMDLERIIDIQRSKLDMEMISAFGEADKYFKEKNFELFKGHAISCQLSASQCFLAVDANLKENYNLALSHFSRFVNED